MSRCGDEIALAAASSREAPGAMVASATANEICPGAKPNIQTFVNLDWP